MIDKKDMLVLGFLFHDLFLQGYKNISSVIASTIYE